MALCEASLIAPLPLRPAVNNNDSINKYKQLQKQCIGNQFQHFVFLTGWNILILVCIYSAKIERAINGETKLQMEGSC